jgi:hypothetical protein
MNACARLLEGIDLHVVPEISGLLNDFQQADQEAIAAFEEALRMDQAHRQGDAAFGPAVMEAKVAQAKALSAASQQRFRALVAAIEAKTTS